MDTKRSISVLICLLTFVTGVQAVDSDVAGSSLLHGRDVQIVAQSDSQMSRQNLRVLHDGQAGRSVDFKLEPGIPLDVTWRLPATATCDELIVTTDARRLSATSPAAAAQKRQSQCTTTHSHASSDAHGPVSHSTDHATCRP